MSHKNNLYYPLDCVEQMSPFFYIAFVKLCINYSTNAIHEWAHKGRFIYCFQCYC